MTTQGAPTSIILCAYRNVVTETMESIAFLRDLGWGYRVGRGDALIERVRSREVSRWYKTTDEDVFLMVDDDVVFAPEHAQRVVDLAREKRAIAVAAYPVKDGTHLACRGFPGQVLTFGPDAPAVEIAMPATGFMAVHRDVITAMIEAKQVSNPDNAPFVELLDDLTRRGLADSPAAQGALQALNKPLVPLCYGNDLETMHWWPFFYAFWIEGQRGDVEPLSEDYAFGERARWLGFKTWLDQSIELYHLGQYPYTIQNMKGPGITHHDAPLELVKAS